MTNTQAKEVDDTAPQPGKVWSGPSLAALAKPAANKPKREWITRRVYGPISMIPCPTPMALVVGYAGQDDPGAPIYSGWEIRPVVCLASFNYRLWTKSRVAGRHEILNTNRQAEREGWAAQGCEVEVEPVILDEESGTLQVYHNWAELSKVGEARLVATPWPRSEDEERLRPEATKLAILDFEVRGIPVPDDFTLGAPDRRNP